MSQIIYGKTYAENIRNAEREYIDAKTKQGLRRPCLVSILTTDDDGSMYYVKSQKKMCINMGVDFKDLILKERSEDEIISTINALNNNPNVDGIMVQLPLSKDINEERVLNTIAPEKDVDGLTDVNMGRFYKGLHCFVPCTARSVITLIKSLNIDIEGKRAVVIGRSNIVGKPVAQLLLNENATVTICHSKTIDLKDICLNSDIVVTAMGRPQFIDESFIKQGAVVIDVGTSSLNGKICGDVNYDKVLGTAGFITPVPGGVGALTTTLLIKNTCEAWKKNVY